jgi:hypothetical protein
LTHIPILFYKTLISERTANKRMPVIDNKSIKTVSALLLKIEAEIRDIRQRLDEVERSISIMNQTNLATSPNLIQIAQEIESEVKEVVAILKPINLDEVDPLEILAIPEIPVKIKNIKKALVNKKKK